MSRIRVTRASAAPDVPVRAVTLESRVDEWLCEWHHHRAAYRHAPGHRSAASSGATLYRTPTYMDSDEVHDAHRDRQRLKTLDEAMEAVRAHNRAWFLALQAQARCLATNVCVWLVPGLPRELPELDVLLQEARNRFARECIARKIDQ